MQEINPFLSYPQFLAIGTVVENYIRVKAIVTPQDI
jgi:hypothetical protein